MAPDLRSYLRDLGDRVNRVHKRVSPDQLSELINAHVGPVLFEDIEGFPDWQLADLLLTDRQSQAVALGVDKADVLGALAARLGEPARQPTVANAGACKEVIVPDEAISLYRLPCFQNGQEDMGPAFMTMNVCRDPDSGNQNLAWTRMTPLSDRRATYFIGSSPHMRQILSRHESAGEDMPMAFVMGTHPAYEIMASYSVLDHLGKFGELDKVAGLLNHEISVVTCESQPLYVPADAELVIEGVVRGTEERVDEGPGPSQALYYHPGITRQPVFEVTAITHRKNPVMRQVNTLLYTDHQSLIGLPHEAMLYQQLRNMDLSIVDVRYSPWGGTLCCLIQLTPAYDGQVREALLYALTQRFPNAKLAIAVDDDVDIDNPEEILWSLSTRVDPAVDTLVIPDMKGHPIDPTARAISGDPRRRSTSKMLIDATKPPLSRAEERRSFRRALPYSS